jgi:PAS domain S-box-containing protein
MLPTTLYESTFNSSPVSNCLLSPTPDAIILAVNEAFLRTASRTREDLVGVSLFSAFPANADDPRDTGEAALRASILQVIASGTPDALPLQRYAMLVTMPDGRRVYEERIWSAVNTPIFDQDGVLACIFHRTTDVTKQVEAEHALRLSEQRYRGLFESIDQGFCIVEVLFDPDGKAIDYRFCDVNPAFEAQTGFDDVIGKTIRELAPGHEQRWFDFFGRVARTGEPVRFESEAKALNRWYEVKAFRVDDPAASRVAVLFDEITARRLAEQDLALKVAALEVAERRQAFQLALADRIRPLSSPHEVTAVACELLGRHLGAERVVYGEADDTGDFLRLRPDWTAGALTTMGGTCLTLDEFGPAIADTVRAGEVLAIDDVTANAHSAPYAGVYLATGIRSFLAIPLMKQGRLEAVLNVHDSAIHPWTEAEIALAHDVVDRIWAAVRYVQEAQKRKEVETQLREKVAQLQFILEAAKIGDAVMDLATGANTHSLQHDRCFGYTEPIADWSYEKFLQHVHPDDRDYVSQDFQDSLAGQKNWHVEFRFTAACIAKTASRKT